MYTENSSGNLPSIDAAETPQHSNVRTMRRAKRTAPVSLGGLTDPHTFDGFTTHDLISGLHGVCVAIDYAIVDGVEFEDHRGTMCGLAMAAKVLSSILHTEVHS